MCAKDFRRVLEGERRIMEYTIVTDSTANLPDTMIDKYQVEVLSLNYYVDGKEYKGYQKGEATDLARFYTMMREKKEIVTSLVNISEAKDTLEAILEKGEDVLYIGFSSGLSGTFQAVSMVIEDLKDSYPNQKIFAVDTLAAALGEGLLVYHALLNREKGMIIDENASWLLQNRMHLCHWFTVDDLFFLKRGGRISSATAVVGTALNVKPVLHVDNEGCLVSVGKTRGRKKSLDALVQHMVDSVEDPEKQMVFISHGDCIEDAEYLANKVRENLAVEDVMVNILDPVIGAHSGPGTVALFFMGNQR